MHQSRACPICQATTRHWRYRGRPRMQTPWQLYAAHRARLTTLLIAAAPRVDGTLLLLGAGRCRDVDLTALARRFTTVHLVDRSADWIAAARAAQPAQVRQRIALH